MITYTDAQGSDEWLAARRGVCTASKFADARSKLKNGTPTKAALAYAMNVAREGDFGPVYTIIVAENENSGKRSQTKSLRSKPPSSSRGLNSSARPPT